MNPDQLKAGGASLLIIVGTILSVLVATGKITAEQSTAFSNSLQALIPAAITVAVVVWRLLGHSDAAKVASMQTVPGVHVQVDTTAATPAVAAVANDPTVKNVNPL